MFLTSLTSGGILARVFRLVLNAGDAVPEAQRCARQGITEIVVLLQILVVGRDPEMFDAYGQTLLAVILRMLDVLVDLVDGLEGVSGDVAVRQRSTLIAVSIAGFVIRPVAQPRGSLVTVGRVAVSGVAMRWVAVRGVRQVTMGRISLMALRSKSMRGIAERLVTGGGVAMRRVTGGGVAVRWVTGRGVAMRRVTGGGVAMRRVTGGGVAVRRVTSGGVSLIARGISLDTMGGVGLISSVEPGSGRTVRI